MNPEKIYLAIVFSVLLFLGHSSLMDYRLAHDFPYGYFASDTFQQQTRAEGIKDQGNYRLEPFYIVKGFRDVTGYYPALLHHQAILLNYLSGIPLYDAIYFTVFLNAILAVFVMYFIIRQFNKKAAILALPLSILIFSDKSYIGFLWGHWASITGQLFLICVFWAISRYEMEKSEILLGIFLGAIGLSHTSELIYGLGFGFIFAALLIMQKKFNLDFIKRMAIAGIILAAIAGYNLYIFANSFAVTNPYKPEVSTDWGGTPIFYITDFKALLIVLLLGAVLSVVWFRKGSVPAMAGFFMLIVGYTNYIGFGIRAFQPRLLWPIYLSYFFGLGLYVLLKQLPQKYEPISVFAASLLFVILFSGIVSVPGIPHYYQASGPGLMDRSHWEAFQWLSKNTPNDSKVYFFYGDIYGQNSVLRNSKRFHGQVDIDGYANAIKNRTILREYETVFPADHGAGMPYMKSFLNIKLHQREETSSTLWGVHKIDICTFDYFVFDKASMQPVLAQYNVLIANDMIENGAQRVFENDKIAILKNEKPGADCIEQRSF